MFDPRSSFASFLELLRIRGSLDFPVGFPVSSDLFETGLNFNQMMFVRHITVRNFTISSHLNLRRSNRIKDLLENAVSGEESKPKTAEDTWSTSPYPREVVFNDTRRDQSKNRHRTFKDPRDTTIILFPGQGTQYVGMAKHLVKIPEARDMYNHASEVLG